MRRRVPDDTSPEAQAIQDNVYRSLSSHDRMAIQFRLGTATRAMTLAGIRSRHPDYTDNQAKMALARLTMGDDLVRKAWPGQDLVEP